MKEIICLASEKKLKYNCQRKGVSLDNTQDVTAIHKMSLEVRLSSIALFTNFTRGFIECILWLASMDQVWIWMHMNLWGSL